MKKHNIFVTRKLPAGALEPLLDFANVTVWQEELPPSKKILFEMIKDFDGLLSLLTDKIDAPLMDSAPNLKIISNYAVGFDNINIEAATKRGIMVTNTPGVLSETTADIAFTLLVAAARLIVPADKFTREGNWKTWEPMLFLGQDIHNAKLGLIGLGRIGYEVAKRAKGFDMDISYYNRTRKYQAEQELGIKFTSLEEILSQSDFISLHVPLTEETRYLINKETLGLMKPNAILINTARGPIVNEKDLYNALVKKTIWGAGLDVMDPEPPKKDNPLFQLDNVVVLPHIGSASIVTRTKMANMAVANMIAGLQGKIPPNLVNTEVLKKM